MRHRDQTTPTKLRLFVLGWRLFQKKSGVEKETKELEFSYFVNFERMTRFKSSSNETTSFTEWLYCTNKVDGTLQWYHGLSVHHHDFATPLWHHRHLKGLLLQRWPNGDTFMMIQCDSQFTIIISWHHCDIIDIYNGHCYNVDQRLAPLWCHSND